MKHNQHTTSPLADDINGSNFRTDGGLDGDTMTSTLTRPERFPNRNAVTRHMEGWMELFAQPRSLPAKPNETK